MRAIETRDAALPLRNLTPREIDRENLPEASLRRFPHSVVVGQVRGFEPGGKPRMEPFPFAGPLIAHQKQVHPDGRSISIDMAAAIPERPKLPDMVGPVTLRVLEARRPAGHDLPKGRARLAFRAEALRDAIPMLQSAGEAGMDGQAARSGKGEFYTFEEFAGRCERLAEGEAAPRLTRSSNSWSRRLPGPGSPRGRRARVSRELASGENIADPPPDHLKTALAPDPI